MPNRWLMIRTMPWEGFRLKPRRPIAWAVSCILPGRKYQVDQPTASRSVLGYTAMNLRTRGNMKKLLLFLTVATSTLLLGATAVTYANIDDQTNVDTGGTSTGWGSCTGSCAGGSVATGYSMSWPQATPSLDGSSREFFISGPSYSDALWWY